MHVLVCMCMCYSVCMSQLILGVDRSCERFLIDFGGLGWQISKVYVYACVHVCICVSLKQHIYGALTLLLMAQLGGTHSCGKQNLYTFMCTHAFAFVCVCVHEGKQTSVERISVWGNVKCHTSWEAGSFDVARVHFPILSS